MLRNWQRIQFDCHVCSLLHFISGDGQVSHWVPSRGIGKNRFGEIGIVHLATLTYNLFILNKYINKYEQTFSSASYFCFHLKPQMAAVHTEPLAAALQCTKTPWRAHENLLDVHSLASLLLLVQSSISWYRHWCIRNYRYHIKTWISLLCGTLI